MLKVIFTAAGFLEPASVCYRTTGLVSRHRQQLDTELKTFAKQLRKTHMYKQQAKH